MIKNLFLVSSFDDVSDLLYKSIQVPLKGKRITFIPTASLHEEVTFYVDAGKEALGKLGLVVDELEISTASSKEISNKLIENDYIYITGGNTFFLLQELRRTGADKIIVEQVNSGKPYIGESAGAIILAPNIEYVKDMDDFELASSLESFDSLNLTDVYPLPHYKDFPFQECSEKIMTGFGEKINITAFNNSQAIVIKGESIEVIGVPATA